MNTDSYYINEEDLPYILKDTPTRISSNPLRYGEPHRAVLFRFHASGDQPEKDDPNYRGYLLTKEFQNIAVCLEDINHLTAMLGILKEASNYTNKLVGKYIILEINNLESCFSNLSKISEEFRTVNSNLIKLLKELDKKYGFKNVRDKLTAHKHKDKSSSVNLSSFEQIELWRAITSESINNYLDAINTCI